MDYTSSLVDYQSARLSLGARIARSWFSTITAKEKVLEATDVVASYTSTLEAVEERYHSGLIDALDLLMAQTALADAKADLQKRDPQKVVPRGRIFWEKLLKEDRLAGAFERGDKFTETLGQV